MALRIRFAHQTGAMLGFSIERLSDGYLYDFTAGDFGKDVLPASTIVPIPEDTGNFVGRFKATMPDTPAAKFPDGDYCVSVHNMRDQNRVIAQLVATMHDGDDSTAMVATSASMGGPFALSMSGTLKGSPDPNVKGPDPGG
jgi:hypothetical protein